MMIELPNAFTEAWEQSWAEEAARAGVAPGTVPILAETPAYPLARAVRMPQDAAYPTGALDLRLLDLAAEGLDRLHRERSRLVTEREAEGTLYLTLPKVRITAACSVDARPDPVVALDVGGNLAELPVGQAPAGHDGLSSPGTDPEKEAWLQQARDQRPQLAQTPNGAALLQTYYANNETYAELFQTSGTVRSQWSNGGITRQMASDTSESLANGTAVNANMYDGQSYNSLAFLQQQNVAFGCYAMSRSGAAADQQRWMQAATAAANFTDAVTRTTGNAASQTRHMTGADVYAATAGADPGVMTRYTPAEVAAAYDFALHPGGAEEMPRDDALLPDGAARARLRFITEAVAREQAEHAATVSAPLFTSRCSAELADVEVAVAYRLDAGNAQVLKTRVTLPDFVLDIDDGGWMGEAGDVARERLVSLHFVHGVLRDAVAHRIGAAVALHAAAGLAALAVRA
jgi:hypothetical protein